ncbi:MAG: hypothetical protein IJT05_07320, partial [Lachnospiraceae bacterium]|nr:hypothetical protein [Lachnospiraceae bacterium]
MKNEAPVQKEKRDTSVMKMIFSIVVIVIAFLAELYVMINQENPVFLILFGLVIVGATFFLAMTMTQADFQRKQKSTEEYENLVRTEKGSYLLLRNNFEHIVGQMDAIDKRISQTEEKMNKEQRAVAKIQIARNKENADAILASNDQILEELSNIDELLENLEKNLLKAISENNANTVREAKGEILSAIQMADMSIRNSIIEIKAAANTSQQPAYIPMPMPMPAVQAPMPAQAPVQAAAPAPMPAPAPAPEPIPEPEPAPAPMPEPVPAPEPIPEPEPEPAPMPESVPVPEPIVVPEPAPAPMPEPVPAPEPIPEPAPEPVTAPAPEPVPEPTPAPEPEPMPAPEPAPAPAPAPEKPPMPDLSDPNHVMTPDEIAALLANTAEPEPAPAPAPEPAPAPAPEKPPMPDLSDPNHVMTPDEIAALLANT